MLQAKILIKHFRVQHRYIKLNICMKMTHNPQTHTHLATWAATNGWWTTSRSEASNPLAWLSFNFRQQFVYPKPTTGTLYAAATSLMFYTRCSEVLYVSSFSFPAHCTNHVCHCADVDFHLWVDISTLYFPSNWQQKLALILTES